MTAGEKTFRYVISRNLREIAYDLIARKKDTRKKIITVASVCTHSCYNTFLVKTGYNKRDCEVTQLSTIKFDKPRDIRMNAGKITCRKVTSWNFV